MSGFRACLATMETSLLFSGAGSSGEAIEGVSCCAREGKILVCSVDYIYSFFFVRNRFDMKLEDPKTAVYSQLHNLYCQ